MVKAFFIFIFLFIAGLNITKAQPGEICNWDSDKQATVVLTFDDWSPGHYPIVVPELKGRGMVATFFPMLTSIANWNHPWPTVIETVSYGNEMGNHSATHPKLSEVSADDLSDEIRGAKTTIDENLNEQTVLSFDYPFGDYNDQVIDSVKNAGHICGRGVNRPSNYPYNFATSDKDYYKLESYGMDSNTDTKTYTDEIDKAINGGGLLVYMYHSVDDANGTYNDNWYAKVIQDSLQKQFDALLSYEDKIWLTTLEQAIKYHREANCATLNELEAFDGKKWILNLSDTLADNELYNQPLSLKVKMNNSGFNEVYQNGNKLQIDSIFNDTIMFKAIPDAGDITLNIMYRDTMFANNEHIEYSGRIDFSDSLAPKFSFSGISIRANFNGTSIAAILNDDMGQNYYNVIIDGVVTDIINTTIGKKEYLLAKDLEDGMHEIELFKRTELTFGKNTFYGFTLDEDKTLSPINNQRELLIEYIGNSITCGYGNEGENGDDFLASTENHYLSYAAITSRNFNARHMAVSRSGIGIYRNYSGPIEGNDDCMTNLYTNTFLYDNNPKYDFAVQPDLVCINLGTNDFSTTGGDSALYTDNYFRLIDTIQTKYDQPEILILLGSMMSGATLTEVREYLNFIADSASNKGKGDVDFFEMSAQTGDLGIGVHYHPTVAQHQRNASELTEYISTLKNWNINTTVLNVETTTSQELIVNFNTAINQTDENFYGFSITNETTDFTIKNISMDENNDKKLIISIEEQFEPGININLDYEPGTIVSLDGVLLKEFKNFKVNNTLTETIITGSKTKADGTYIKLTFNKKINQESTINGLSFFSKNESVAIDSFSISSKYITCYITPLIKKDELVYANYNGSNIIGLDDNITMQNFTDLSINNNSTVTAIFNTLKNDAFKIWPNPNTTSTFNYKSNQKNTSDYVVYNLAGSIVNKGQLNDNEGKIILDKNTSIGSYFIKINTDDQIETHKLLIIN